MDHGPSQFCFILVHRRDPNRSSEVVVKQFWAILTANLNILINIGMLWIPPWTARNQFQCVPLRFIDEKKTLITSMMSCVKNISLFYNFSYIPTPSSSIKFTWRLNLKPDTHGQTFHLTKSEVKLDGKLNAKKFDGITVGLCDIVTLRKQENFTVVKQKLVSANSKDNFGTANHGDPHLTKL